MSKHIIVVGSGVAAAATVTKLLSANPKAKITVIEAGDKIRMRDFKLFQNYLVNGKLPYDTKDIYDSCMDLPYADRDRPGENVRTGDTEIPMNGSRSIIYGGSTVHWGGWAFRLKPEDFKLKSNTWNQQPYFADVIDWPISYDELEPFYTKAEHFIGVSGNSKDLVTPRSGEYPFPHFPYTKQDGVFIEAFKNMEPKISYSHLPIARYGVSSTNTSHAPCQTTGLCKYCPFGARFVAANNFDDLLNSAEYPNLKVYLNRIVQEVLMKDRSTARGVRFLNKAKNKVEVMEADLVILALGAVEGPKLLQRSVSEFWIRGIGNDRDLVGRFLVSHPYFFFKAIMPDNKEMMQPEMGFPTLVSRHFDSPEEQTKGKFILINPASSPKVNLQRSMAAGLAKEKIIDSISRDITLQLQGIIEVFSQHSNRVLNSNKTNRFGMQETAIHFSKDSGFDTRMAEVQQIVEVIFANVGAQKVEVDIPISWRADHAGCTTRMSTSAEEGVVDHNLRIHGTDNLYVISNSSFSSLGAVNPTLTLTALAIRLGEHLNEQL